MDEHLKRQLRELSNTHAAAVQAATANLNTSAARMALDSYPSLSAMAGMSEQIAALTHHHADALKQVRLTADRMSLGNMAAMVDISKIGRQMQEAMSAHTSAISMAGISLDRDWFEQTSSWRGAIEKVRNNLTFPVDDWSAGAIGRAMSDLSAARSFAHEAFARVGINDLADVFANSGIGRYSDVLDSLQSSLKHIRTQDDFERVARAAFQQADDITIDSLDDDAVQDETKERAKVWSQLTPFQQLELRYWVINAILMILLWGIDRYFPVERAETAPKLAQVVRPSYAPSGRPRIFVVQGDNVNVRSGPGPNYKDIHSVSRGDIVRKIKQRRSWCQVEHKVGDESFVRGWMKCKYLSNVDLMVGDVAISIFDDMYGST